MVMILLGFVRKNASQYPANYSILLDKPCTIGITPRFVKGCGFNTLPVCG